MEVEAALLPPNIRLDASTRQYVFRILKLALTHPINAEATLDSTQLDRIRKSIHSLVDIDSLEQIQHFKYPPWERDTPYTVQIDKLPKEEAALVHIKANEVKNRLAGTRELYSIYTDASYIPRPESTGIGIGLAMYQHTASGNKLKYQKSANIGSSQLVYNGELEGITLAAEYASKIARPNQEIAIYADNQAALLRLKTPSDRPGQACQIRTSTAINAANEKGATVHLNWVLGHEDIPGNELADALAKSAT